MTAETTSKLSDNSVCHLIITHFDAHQRYNQDNNYKENKSSSPKKPKVSKSKYRYNNGDVSRRVHLIRRDVSACLSSPTAKNVPDKNVSSSNKKDEGRRKSVEEDLSSVIDKMSTLAVIDDVQDEVAQSILQCVDAVFVEAAQRGLSNDATKNKEEEWEESCDRTLELAAVLSCGMREAVSVNVLISRVEYCSKFSIDDVRAKSCYFLGLCLKSLQFCCDNKMKKKNEHNSSSKENDTDPSSKAADLWRKNCIRKISSILQPRITDKTLNVRVAAIKASKHIFQTFVGDASVSKSMIKQLVEIDDHSKPILLALVRRISHDSTISCRVQALQSVPISKKTLRSIIDRIRDVKDKVRVTALDVLRKVDVHLLEDDQRCTILRSGLSARCQTTREATVKMLCCGWMKSVKFDPLRFLQLLDAPNNETISEMAMREIISLVTEDKKDDKNRSEIILRELSEPEVGALKDSVLSPMDVTVKGFIDPAHILFMHTRCAAVSESTSLNDSQKQEIIGELMYDIPTLTEALGEHLRCYIDIIENPIEEDQQDNDEIASLEDSHWFVCLQLLKLVKYADLQEAGSRRCFTAALHNILCSLDTPDGLLDETVKAFKCAYTVELEFIDAVSEMVQHISQGLQETFPEEDGVTDELNCPKNNDTLSLNSHMHIIIILSSALEHLSSKSTSSSIWDRFLDPISAAVTSSNPQLREIGVSCLGRFALLSDGSTVNSEIMPLLEAIANNDDEVIEVRAKSAMAICDLVLLFHSELSSKLENFSSLLFRLFDHEKSGFVCVASEVCVKLLLAGTFKDEAIVARLLVIFFSDKYDDEKEEEEVDDIKEIGSMVRLQQLLCVFFPAYSMKSVENRDVILRSTKVVLYLVYEELRERNDAGKSILASVNKITDYTFTLIDMGEKHMASYQANNDAAEEKNDIETSNLSTMITILDFLTENCDLPSNYLRALCKIASGVCLNGEEDKAQIRKFSNQLVDLEMILSDKSALKTIQKLYDTLEPLESEAETSDIIDQSMISKIQNISLIAPDEDIASQIQNISLLETNDINNSQIQDILIVPNDNPPYENIITEQLLDPSLQI